MCGPKRFVLPSPPMKHLAVVALLVATVACNKDKAKDSGETPPAAGSAATMAGSSATAPTAGSATTGSATAMAGSNAGSAAAGSAAAGSDAAMAGSAMSGSGTAGSDDFNWEAMSQEQRVDYMKKTVVPTMKPLFQQFDAKHYEKFGCKTCHGKDPKAAKFKMPTPDLPPLDFAALKAGKQKPEVAKWMADVVKPQMAKLMHEPEYTEQNPKGFGCLECHTQKK